MREREVREKIFFPVRATYVYFRRTGTGVNNIHNLSKDPDAKVSMPTNYEVKFYREATWAEKPICDNVWAAADGLKLLIQESTTDSKQN